MDFYLVIEVFDQGVVLNIVIKHLLLLDFNSNFTHLLYKYSGTYWIAFIFHIYVSIIYLNIAHTLF